MITYVESVVVRGEILARLGRGREAVSMARRAFSLSEGLAGRYPAEPVHSFATVEISVALGTFLHGVGLEDEAHDAFRTGYERGRSLKGRFPDRFPEIHETPTRAAARFGRFLLSADEPRLRDPIRAAALASEAIDLSPGSAEAWSVLGEAHYRARHWDEAIAALSRVVDKERDVAPSIALLLAMAHWQRGDEGRAITLRRKAIALFDGKPTTDAAWARLRDEAAELITYHSWPFAGARPDDWAASH
jgi:tetratricopeptide (TPR) repeat protein